MRPISIISSYRDGQNRHHLSDSPTTADGIRVRQEIATAMSRFLMIEAEVGASFARAASAACSTREVLHYRQLARLAYDTAARMAGQTKLEEGAAKTLARALKRLNTDLSDLGDPQ